MPAPAAGGAAASTISDCGLSSCPPWTVGADQNSLTFYRSHSNASTISLGDLFEGLVVNTANGINPIKNPPASDSRTAADANKIFVSRLHRNHKSGIARTIA